MRAWLFLLVGMVACHRKSETITKTDIDAAPPPPLAPPAPLRPLPTGWYLTEDRARIELRLAEKIATLKEHVETERAPLIVEGPYTSEMARDGSFNVTMTVKELKKEFLSRCRDCGKKDVHEALNVASFDGQPITKDAQTKLTLTFSEDDRFVEMCIMPWKKCERLKRA